MLLKNNKIIFLHIGKCAGTSIEQHLLNKYTDIVFKQLKVTEPNYEYMFGYEPKYGCYLQHADINLYKKIGFNLKDYFVFTIVRNPYNRLFSAYCYNFDIKQDDKDIYTKFNDFVHNDLKRYYNYNKGYTVNHFGEMNKYTHLEDYVVNKIVKFERLYEELDFIEFKDDNRRPAKTNASMFYNNYMEAYDQKSLSVVNTIYEKDFELYNYKNI